MMERRHFILSGIGFALHPHFAAAQPSRKPRAIGWLAGLSQAAAAPLVRAFANGMREFGYSDGRDFRIEYRFADGDMAQLPRLATELLELKPDLILAASTAQAIIVKNLTSTIPIVVPALADAIAAGLIASEARPNGNVTGITPYIKGLPAKQLELAREVVPRAAKIGLIDDVTDVKAKPQRQEIETAATDMGVRIVIAEVRTPSDLEPALQMLAKERSEAAIVLQTTMLLNERRLLASLAEKWRVPTVYGYGQHVQAGGLASYGIDLPACFHRAAYFVTKIFNGWKPGDIPVEFPTKMLLNINLKTAKALGIEVSPYLLARADEVIE